MIPNPYILVAGHDGGQIRQHPGLAFETLEEAEAVRDRRVKEAEARRWARTQTPPPPRADPPAQQAGAFRVEVQEPYGIVTASGAALSCWNRSTSGVPLAVLAVEQVNWLGRRRPTRKTVTVEVPAGRNSAEANAAVGDLIRAGAAA